MKIKACSRCGVKIKKGREKRVADFNSKGLKDATFCENCFKYHLKREEKIKKGDEK